MGKHSADDGAGVDPFVAAALAQRPPSAEPTEPRHAPGLASVEADGSGLGWPGDPADGSGLGWPAREGEAAATTDAARPARRPGVWRRLFGGTRQDSSAA